MKKALLAIAFAGLAVAQLRADTIKIDFSLGILSNSLGNPITDGSLIQIIAAPTSSTFASPTATDFLGGSSDEYLVYSGAFDSTTTGISGAETFTANIDLATYPIAGDALIVRWYPSLTTSSSAPGLTTYGQFGYPNNPSSLDSTNTWIAPSGGGSVSFSFLTTGAGGPYPNSMGNASLTVSAVPEPSNYVVIIGISAVLIGLRYRRRVEQAEAK
ncbi:MAG TPA: hypothetical protein VIM48_06895 [Chthoniobacterales bacterium]